MAEALAMLERLIAAIEAAERRSGGLVSREALRLAGEARLLVARKKREAKA